MGLPVSLEHVLGMIEIAEYEMISRESKYWKTVKIAPTKWSLPPWGDYGGGFWVVARYGNYAVYYNDIEEGFNESRVLAEGILKDYYCNQSSLGDFVRSKANYLACDETPNQPVKGS